MSARPERQAGWAVLGYLVLMIAVALVAMPATAIVMPVLRPVVVRLACAVVLAVLLLHLRASLVRRIEGDQPIAVSQAPLDERSASAPVLDRWFIDLHEAVKWSIRSQRYFDAVLLPRLRVLARRALDAPRLGGWGRGGRLAHLRALVIRLERQS